VRCSHYSVVVHLGYGWSRHTVRCSDEATTALLAPGETADKPSDPMCREHGEAVLAEYNEKLDPGWRLVDVDEWGRVRE
jgi:hypothetical protein